MAIAPQLSRWKLKDEAFPLTERDQQTVRDLLGPGAPAPSAPPAPPGAALDPIGIRYPFGPTDFAYLYAQILNISAGPVLSGTIEVDAEPDAAILFTDRFSLTTDNGGTPGHSVTGPNLTLEDLATSRVRAIWRSIGQLSLHLQDENLEPDTISHALQLHAKTTGALQTTVGFGTGIQLFATDDTDVEREFGNLQFFWMNATTRSSAFVLRAMVTGTSTALLQSIPSGHVQATKKLLATEGLGSGGSVAATVLTAPGTVILRLPVFDEAGALLGSLPVYPAGSFS